ncbi:MAG: DNA topoisomerase 4 subunit A [Planctomycetaceae bacterium]|nr:DNA topoisomerase 4 subunit A [Planctomycetaceae bacterium]
MSEPRDESNGTAAPESGGDRIKYVSISTETRQRYLNYALSVITARALPDVRDGLKPVQRRILYAMYDGLGLTADSRYVKSMKICGDTTGDYHPHGTDACYEALVRMAQDFTLRYPLVDGWGNFGSVIGLPAAASRYTEARLRALAEQLMNELRFETVDFRPTYDARKLEPIVVPARFPNLLVNGTQGIAVGMATSIPPHNLREAIEACIHLIHNRDASVAQLMKHVKGPDFPMGGRIVTERSALRQMYEEGRGSIKVRAEWQFDREKRKEVPDRLVIHSIPYGVETGPLLAEIGAIVANRKLPQLLDVTDLSDSKNGLRIVLQLKPGAAPEAVMAFLYKHSQLEQNFAYNCTCLVPDEQRSLVPRRVNLAELLRHFLDFRFDTVKRRYEYILAQLKRRIHILEGFKIVFDGLDRALKIIRASDGKQDAAQKLMKAFPLDEPQTIAILELQLYRISQLEIDDIVKELRARKQEAAETTALLASNRRLWKVVETELKELAEKFGDKRRTSLGSTEEIAEFNPEAYIVRENTNVVVSREGWIKRVGRLASVEQTRVREGDQVLTVTPGSTLDHTVFFSSEGVAYTLRIDQVPSSSGYGEPLAKHFRLGDGASIVAAITTDPRFTPTDSKVKGEESPAPFLLVATARGQVLRIPLHPFRTASTKVGRKYCRLAQGDRVVFVDLVREATTMFLASAAARIIHFKVKEVPVLSGAGKGVRGIKITADDQVLGAALLTNPRDCLKVETTAEKEMVFGQVKYEITSRGGKGVRTSHRSGFTGIIRPPIELVDWSKFEVQNGK